MGASKKQPPAKPAAMKAKAQPKKTLEKPKVEPASPAKLKKKTPGEEGEGVSRKEISGFLTGLKYKAENPKDPRTRIVLLPRHSWRPRFLNNWQCLMSGCVAFFCRYVLFCWIPPCQKYHALDGEGKHGLIATYMKEGGIKNLSWVASYLESSETKETEMQEDEKGFFTMHKILGFHGLGWNQLGPGEGAGGSEGLAGGEPQGERP